MDRGLLLHRAPDDPCHLDECGLAGAPPSRLGRDDTPKSLLPILHCGTPGYHDVVRTLFITDRAPATQSKRIALFTLTEIHPAATASQTG